MHEVVPTFWADIRDELAGFQLVSLSLDAYGQALILGVSDFDYVERRGDSSPQFPKLKTKTPHDFVVLQIGTDHIARFHIPNQYWNFHHVQTLPNDELLLVCSRSEFRGQDDYDLNGNVFSAQGVIQREFWLGDGIADIQTTRSGKIWTSYFDEGVIGNTTLRNFSGTPAALVQWDSFGKLLFNYAPASGLDSVLDVYALNAETEDNIWFYYYTQFPVVLLKNNRIQDFWLSPKSYSKAMAIWRDYVLFFGDPQHRDNLYLLKLLENHTMEAVATYSVNADYQAFAARGSRIVLLEDSSLLYIDLRELIK